MGAYRRALFLIALASTTFVLQFQDRAFAADASLSKTCVATLKQDANKLNYHELAAYQDCAKDAESVFGADWHTVVRPNVVPTMSYAGRYRLTTAQAVANACKARSDYANSVAAVAALIRPATFRGVVTTLGLFLPSIALTACTDTPNVTLAAFPTALPAVSGSAPKSKTSSDDLTVLQVGAQNQPISVTSADSSICSVSQNDTQDPVYTVKYMKTGTTQINIMTANAASLIIPCKVTAAELAPAPAPAEHPAPAAHRTPAAHQASAARPEQVGNAAMKTIDPMQIAILSRKPARASRQVVAKGDWSGHLDR